MGGDARPVRLLGGGVEGREKRVIGDRGKAQVESVEPKVQTKRGSSARGRHRARPVRLLGGGVEGREKRVIGDRGKAQVESVEPKVQTKRGSSARGRHRVFVTSHKGE